MPSAIRHTRRSPSVFWMMRSLPRRPTCSYIAVRPVRLIDTVPLKDGPLDTFDEQAESPSATTCGVRATKGPSGAGANAGPDAGRGTGPDIVDPVPATIGSAPRTINAGSGEDAASASGETIAAPGRAAAATIVSTLTASADTSPVRRFNGRTSSLRMAMSRCSRRLGSMMGSAASAAAGCDSAKSSSTRAYVDGRAPSARTA
jgi:hypothetical protein